MLLQNRLPRIRHRTLWRLFWLVVLILHSPATVAVFSRAWVHGAADSWTSLFLLTGSNLFFLLEITFSPSLQVMRSRRSLVVFIVIVAILHAGVIDKGFSELMHMLRDGDMMSWTVVTMLGAALVRLLLATAGMIHRSLEDAAASWKCLFMRRRRYGLIAVESRRPPIPCAADRSVPPRAPPFSTS